MFEIIRIDGLGGSYNGEPLVIALGNFDGVHLGHVKIINAARDLAKRLSASCAVLAFDVHPQNYFSHGSVKLITDEADRFELMRSAGAEYVVRASFARFKDMSPLGFMKLLRDGMNCVGACCGYNFRFGKNGAGTSEDISGFFAPNAVIEEKFTLDGEDVSSSEIRNAVESGNVKCAARLLGRPFFVSGRVKSGRQIGRTMDFPTANITIDASLLAPKIGIYATFTEVRGKIYPSVTNYGHNPTVTDLMDMILETYIIGFSGDIYSERIRVYFVDKIRDQKKFASVAELRQAIASDKISAERICSEYDTCEIFKEKI